MSTSIDDKVGQLIARELSSKMTRLLLRSAIIMPDTKLGLKVGSVALLNTIAQFCASIAALSEESAETKLETWRELMLLMQADIGAALTNPKLVEHIGELIAMQTKAMEEANVNSQS